MTTPVASTCISPGSRASSVCQNSLFETIVFDFAKVIETAGDTGKANPWTLLGGRNADGRIPAIVDQTSLQYVLHAAVGDVLTIDADTSRPIDLHIVASLDDSVLQGEILIGEAAFRDAFPGIAGTATS